MLARYMCLSICPSICQMQARIIAYTKIAKRMITKTTPHLFQLWEITDWNPDWKYKRTFTDISVYFTNLVLLLKILSPDFTILEHRLFT